MALIDQKVRIGVSLSDKKIVEYQLKRNDIKFLGVTVRCKFNCPAVIAQDPFFTRNIIFPTLFYLCCPRLIKTIGGLESSAFFKTVKASVRIGGVWRQNFLSFLDTYRRVVGERVAGLYRREDGKLIRSYELFINDSRGAHSPCIPDALARPETSKSDDASSFQFYADNNSGEQNIEVNPELLEGLLKRGLAGSASDEAIKCLHAFYAFLLSFGREPVEPEIAFFRNIIEEEMKKNFARESRDIF